MPSIVQKSAPLSAQQDLSSNKQTLSKILKGINEIKCPAQENLVISGMAGRFPETESVDEFWQKLLEGVPLITSDNRRWPVGK